MRRALCALVTILFVGAVCNRPFFSQDQAPLRVDVNLVSIFLTVEDPRGEFVPDLSSNDFHVYEDDVEQKIGVFEKQDTVQSAIGLLIDNSGSMVDILPPTREGVLRFARTSKRFDQMFVYTFGSNVRLLHDVRDPERDLETRLKSLRASGTSVLYDALLEGMRKSARSENVRKALIVFTDGNDNGSNAGYGAVSREAQRSGVLLYFIAIGSRVLVDEHTLESLASQSGGRVFYLSKTDPVAPTLDGIRVELSKQYYLGYYAPRRPGFHAIRVEISTHKDLHIRAKNGYYGS
jgi:Ca-activated chloride channel family protein